MQSNNLTEADVNLLKLVDATQRMSREKRFQYKNLKRISNINNQGKTAHLIENYIQSDKMKDFEKDKKILSNK